MSFARLYVRIGGYVALLFGAVYLLVPSMLTGPAGFGALAAGGLTDVRATYGGFQLGLGAFLLWAAQEDGRLRGALVLMALSLGAVAFSRATGLLLDGSFNGFHASGLTFEISFTAFTLYALRRATGHEAVV